MKKYPSSFKARVVLETLKNEKTLSQIASEARIDPKNIQNWKKELLENIELVFDKEKAVTGYKEQVREKERQIDALYKQNGKLNLMLEWAKKKSEEYGLPVPQGDSYLEQIS